MRLERGPVGVMGSRGARGGGAEGARGLWWVIGFVVGGRRKGESEGAKERGRRSTREEVDDGQRRSASKGEKKRGIEFFRSIDFHAAGKGSRATLSCPNALGTRAHNRLVSLAILKGKSIG